MKKICLLIGEGDSERYFFPKILETKGFHSLSLKEGSMSIYNKESVYWFFPYPPNLGTTATGKSKLKKPEIYTLAYHYVQTNAYIFEGDVYEVHLVAISDSEMTAADFNSKGSEITSATVSSGIPFASAAVFPVEVQIESWYFAGLKPDFPYFLNAEDSDLIKLLSSKTTNRHNKANFESHIDFDKMIGAKDIAQAVAEHFDGIKAVAHSDSFRNFDQYVKDKGLY